jgi:hypothetical protein
MLEQTHEWFGEHRAQARAIAESELELRRLGFDAPDQIAQSQAQGALSQWARALELTLVCSAIQEAVALLGLRTVAEVIRQHDRVDAFVRILSRLDPLRVFEDNRAVLEPLRHLQPHADGPASPDMDLVVQAARSLLEHCPMAALERAGHDHSLAELAHRCRVAYDGLVALVARNSQPGAEALRTAGQAYAEGRLSIDEVASVLALPVPDAIALLEEQGYRRSIEGLRLTDEARQLRLAAIRAERRARGGMPVVRPDLVRREVIASQRIEDVDARPWLKT